MKIILIFLIAFISLQTFASTTPVKIVFMEALAPRDTTSSDRFQKEYEYAIQTGKDLTKVKLEKCGYHIVDEKTFYDSSDTLQAMEKAKKAQDEGAWLIVGPRRSNHYLLVSKGATETPAVSVMASAKEVFELNPIHLTLAQSNEKMANVAARSVKSKFKNKKQITYLSVVSEDCVTCVDFADGFYKSADKLKFKRVSEVKITGEQPDISHIEKIIKTEKPDFVLLPNYSKVSALLIGTIYRWRPETFFVGGDGWGDNKYGFVHHSPQLQSANGLTVKGFPPTDKGLGFFPLGKEILKNPNLAAAFPASGSAQSLLKAIEGTVNVLCASKPKNKSEFTKAFASQGKKHFNSPWGVSVFTLNEGEIHFERTVR